MDAVQRILELFETRGAADYLGEPVSQREHALEAAQLAIRDGASDALVAAALLHDIGHLLGPEDNPADRGIDGLHEDAGCAWLRQAFGPEVTEPVRLHVAAKRCLCAVEPDYRSRLSPASVHSLELQGGPMSDVEVREFEALRFHADAVRLRRWDDEAKIPGLPVPVMQEYVELLRRVTV
jgi:gamma-butyrobetaine dioxygenase